MPSTERWTLYCSHEPDAVEKELLELWITSNLDGIAVQVGDDDGQSMPLPSLWGGAGVSRLIDDAQEIKEFLLSHQ